jgi:hypothetical protein
MNTADNSKAPARTGATEKDCMYANNIKSSLRAQATMRCL